MCWRIWLLWWMGRGVKYSQMGVSGGGKGGGSRECKEDVEVW
jgi:hypothetical protein